MKVRIMFIADGRCYRLWEIDTKQIAYSKFNIHTAMRQYFRHSPDLAHFTLENPKCFVPISTKLLSFVMWTYISILHFVLIPIKFYDPKRLCFCILKIWRLHCNCCIVWIILSFGKYFLFLYPRIPRWSINY